MVFALLYPRTFSQSSHSTCYRHHTGQASAHILHLSVSHRPVFLLNSCLSLFSAAHSRGHPFSRSYGVILPSSLTILLPPALGFSPHPPVSVYGTGTYKAIADFLGTGLTCFATFISLRVTLSAHAADLPAAHLLRLHRYFHSRPMLSPCVPTVLFICGTGI